jgi:hypothetical protein
MPIGRPFRPGQSGNLGGRPKGVARTVREACGGDPTMLAERLLAIAQGTVCTVSLRLDTASGPVGRG